MEDRGNIKRHELVESLLHAAKIEVEGAYHAVVRAHEAAKQTDDPGQGILYWVIDAINKARNLLEDA